MMKTRFVAMSVALPMIVIFAAVGWGMIRAHPAHAFIQTALTDFRRCRRLADVRALRNDGKSQMVIWEFQDRSWIAVRNHPSDHYADDWDATVILDSRGQLYWTDKHFCAGFEREKAEAPPIPSLRAFHRMYAAAFSLRPVE